MVREGNGSSVNGSGRCMPGTHHWIITAIKQHSDANRSITYTFWKCTRCDADKMTVKR
jgi:hypothetical protein